MEEMNNHHHYHQLPGNNNEEIEGPSSQKHNQNKVHLNKYAFAGAILASTNSILLGYDIGVMSGAVIFIKEDLNITSLQVEILVGCLNVCSLIGSLASGKFSDLIGRRYTIMIAAATFLIGALLMGLAPSFSFLMFGRVIAGIGVGFSLMISPVYVAELSPDLTRALVLDKFGRRPMLLLGSSGMAVSLFGLGLGCTLLQNSNEKPIWAIALCVVAVCANVSFFSIGLGPITWVYSSEIFPMRLRAQGSSLAISVNRLISGIVSMSFLSISEEITFGGMFFVLGGVMVVATIFFYNFLPETKGKSLEEIQTLFEDETN
uniref:Probable polyol transporter 3 isoform X2 n=1 Tax=Cicer arietinum TaxID=3827 RepID=A0A3Q7YH02_CICAR|nr:probable polyol transporter 3 isoform X2 [Cicer arietinum]